MWFWKLGLVLSVGFLLGPILPLQAAAETSLQQSAGKKTVVLLLRNRNVIEGELVTEGEIYRLRVSQGEIFVPRREVLAVADSIKTLYEQERSRLFGREAEPHLELAIWCAEHGLKNEAWTELSQARAIDPRHPGLPLATRRVEMALVRSSHSSDGGSQLSQSGMAQGAPFSSLPSQQNAELLASTERNSTESNTLGLPKVRDPSTLFRGLPQGTGEQFVRVIQPIINHYCATAGCHGGPKMDPQLRLLRIPESRSPLRGEIAQNLQVVLSWLDFEQPGASSLLKVPLEPHGGLPAPVFSGTDMKQYRELVDWVYAVTRRRTPPPPPGEDSGAENLSAGDNHPSPPLPGAAGIQLDTMFPLADAGVQQVAHESPMEAQGSGVVPAAGGLPGPIRVPQQATAITSKGDGAAQASHPVISHGSFLQSNPEAIPAIRWTFEDPKAFPSLKPAGNLGQ